MTELKRITATQHPDMIIRINDIIESSYNKTFLSKAYTLENKISNSGKIVIVSNTDIAEEITIKYVFPFRHHIDISSMYPIMNGNITIRIVRLNKRITYKIIGLSHIEKFDVISGNLSNDFNKYFDRFSNSASPEFIVDPSLLCDIIHGSIKLIDLSKKIEFGPYGVSIMDSSEKELKQELMNYELNKQ